MNLYFKYRLLLPFLSRLPQTIAYRLASASSRLGRAEHAAEIATIMQQLQCVFSVKSPAELAHLADYFFAMVEREALDTWFLEPVQPGNS